MNIINLNNDVFRKCIFGRGLIYFIILQICFYDYLDGSNINTYADSLKYQVESEDIGEINAIFPYHILHKREAVENSTVTTNDTEIPDDNNNLPPPATTPAAGEGVTKKEKKNSTEAPTTEPSPSLYNSDSKEEDEGFKLGEFDDSPPPKNFDHHRYYKSYSKTGMDKVHQYWVDLDKMPEEKVVVHDSLSSAYRRALTVSLTFDFPFYGHTLNNVTIATGGFLFTGSFLHKWLAATQYIAPLMANFDTSVSMQAAVKYADNGTSLTVQWEKVVLQDNPSAGSFTFQVTIHKTGHIVFAYKDIPVLVPLIEDKEHPVKVGLSDAYIVEKTIFYVRKKTIYEYHKIDLKKGMQISNWTAIIFEPLPLCVSLNTCTACLTTETSFKCEWCQEIGRCSHGLDRHRQTWLESQCEHSSISNASVCAYLPPPSPSPTSALASGPIGAASLDSSSGGSRKSMWIGLFMTLLIIAFAAGWVTYAYLHPHTTSGQILIKYRPSAWSWRRGEARYTAATMHSIHM